MSKWFAKLILLCLISSSFPAAADEPPVGMVTGSPTGTYVKFGRDIATVSARNGIIIDVKESKGSIDNIRRLNSQENAAIGIVQSDVLGYLGRIQDPTLSTSIKDLRMVFPFYKEEVHLLADNSIKSFSDLKNKKVVVGPEGSGSWLTAMNLFSMMNIMPREIVRVDSTEGLTMVLTKKADAILFVGGKPVQLFRNIDELAKIEKGRKQSLVSGVHLVPLNDPQMLEEYSKAELTSKDYAFVDKTVPTIAATAVLMSFDFSSATTEYAKKRCDIISGITWSIQQSLDELKAKGHPKWAEVNPDQDVKIWKKDPCARLDQKHVMNPQNQLEKQLLSTIKDKYHD